MQSPFTFEAEQFKGYAASDELEFLDGGQPSSSRGKATPSQRAVSRIPNIQGEEGASPGTQESTFALLRAIPDIPSFPTDTPFYYWLDAKEIVGKVAQDLSTRGESAHIWVEVAHAGVLGAEIFAEALALGASLVAGLTIGGALLGVVAAGLALGAPYYEAAKEIAADWAARGFSRGVVMGADKCGAKLLKDYFGNEFIAPNAFIPNGQSIATGNYKVGLLVGFVQGRLLSLGQRAVFWRDLGYRMGYQSYRGPQEQWQRSQWIDWYLTAANFFRRDHLV